MCVSCVHYDRGVQFGHLNSEQLKRVLVGGKKDLGCPPQGVGLGGGSSKPAVAESDCSQKLGEKAKSSSVGNLRQNPQNPEKNTISGPLLKNLALLRS